MLVGVALHGVGIGHHRRFPHPLKTPLGQRGGGADLCAVFGLERDGRLIAERGVQALAVVDLVDEGADVVCRDAVITIAGGVDLFTLERSDEALGFGVVVGIADPAHAGGNSVGLQQAGVLGTGVLHAAVGMVD